MNEGKETTDEDFAIEAEVMEEQGPVIKKIDSNFVRHQGGCHCGAVRFAVSAPSNPTVIDCNCSVCTKKQNRHFIVPQENFKLLKGHDVLTTYSFNTHKAKHTFCSVCGVQSFYIPRCNTDAYGIAIHCVDEGTVSKPTVHKFDGKNWEQAVKKQSAVLEPAKEKKRKIIMIF